jgi:hypothetical protein
MADLAARYDADIVVATVRAGRDNRRWGIGWARAFL